MEGQEAALASAGCSKVFQDRLSGAKADRPGLAAALDYVRDGEDTLVVARLDRLGRSLPDALRIVLRSSRFPSRCWIQRVQEPGSGPAHMQMILDPDPVRFVFEPPRRDSPDSPTSGSKLMAQK